MATRSLYAVRMQIILAEDLPFTTFIRIVISFSTTYNLGAFNQDVGG